MDNKVKFETFPEEVEFQNAIIKFKLVEKARMQRLARAIEHAHKKYIEDQESNRAISDRLEKQHIKEVAAMQLWQKKQNLQITNTFSEASSLNLVPELRKQLFEK